MRSFWVSILLGVIIAVMVGSKSSVSFSAQVISPKVTVCFTPGDRCDLRLISAIRSAHSTIEVQAYQLTSKPIQRALVGAYQSGVKVEIILDKSQLWSKREAPALYLSTFNIPIWIDNKVKIAHNKVMIIDGKEVITGSYNYSRAAQYSNAENMVIIRSSEIAGQYQRNFDYRLAASEKFDVVYRNNNNK